MDRLARASRNVSGAVLAGTSFLVAAVACDHSMTPPGKEISGTIRIPTALRPLLSGTELAQGQTVPEVEPNGYPLPTDYTGPNFQDIGTLETDGTPVTLVGTLDFHTDPRDRFAFQLSEPGSVTVTVTHSSASAVNNIFIARGTDWPDDGLDQLAYRRIFGRNDDTENQVTVSAVLPAGETFLLHIRYYQTEGGSTGYSATIQVEGGTLVGTRRCAPARLPTMCWWKNRR